MYKIYKCELICVYGMLEGRTIYICDINPNTVHMHGQSSGIGKLTVTIYLTFTKRQGEQGDVLK